MEIVVWSHKIFCPPKQNQENSWKSSFILFVYYYIPDRQFLFKIYLRPTQRNCTRKSLGRPRRGSAETLSLPNIFLKSQTTELSRIVLSKRRVKNFFLFLFGRCCCAVTNKRVGHVGKKNNSALVYLFESITLLKEKEKLLFW